MKIYLYVKTHNVTGLKYLGKTIKNPETYKGSGKRWLNHIKKHGYNVTTEILLITESAKEIKDTGIFFSRLWNIVESKEWANLMEETGTGGRISDHSINKMSERKKGKTYEELYGEQKAKILKEKLKNRVVSDETRRKQSDAHSKTIGETHSRFDNYYYITPWGTFASITIAAKMIPCDGPVNEEAIRNWCVIKNNSKLTRHTISRIKYFNKDQIGNTFNELGFDYKHMPSL